MTRSPTDTRLSGTFLRICSGLPWLSQAYYDQAPSCCTLMSTQLSLIMQDRKAAAQSSLFFHLPKYFWGSNSGSLWRVISERTHWCGGLGEGHVWTHRREREGESKRVRGSHVCTYVSRLGSAASLRNPLQNIHPFPPLVLKVPCRSDASPLCSVQGPNNSYGFIKAPKGRKCGFCSDFPLPMIKLESMCCQFLKWNG